MIYHTDYFIEESYQTIQKTLGHTDKAQGQAATFVPASHKHNQTYHTNFCPRFYIRFLYQTFSFWKTKDEQSM